jgi:hypothetical protein
MRFNFKLTLMATFVVFLLGLSTVYLASAAPVGPTTITDLGSSRYGTPGAANISAIAGNVTELNFNVTFSTTTWQGYFGNITGTIVLGNSNNQSLYDWDLATPRGQVYATRTPAVPTWTAIKCANRTEINNEDTALGVNQSFDQDSVNRTFLNTTEFGSFYVGATLINSTAVNGTGFPIDCFATYLNDQNGDPTSAFSEVVLSDTNNTIYTGIIALPTTGFDGRSHQFQMLVGENGHNGDSTATPYYFYLELS